MFDPEVLLDGLTKELQANVKTMGKMKSLEEKRLQSEIVKNLSDSVGVFLTFMSDMMDTGMGGFDFNDDEDEI